jgi:hypothetical protein
VQRSPGPAQIRAARALIRWSAPELADQAAVGVTTVRRAELTASATALTRANDLAIRRTQLCRQSCEEGSVSADVS